MHQKVCRVHKYSRGTITTDQLRGKNSEDSNYLEMAKLAAYSVPKKIIAVATNQNPPPKFLQRMRYSVICV